MFFLCLAAFANCLMILQNNRANCDASVDPTCAPAIFDSYIGIGPIDALIHAYLTGLGDFNKDNYSA